MPRVRIEAAGEVRTVDYTTAPPPAGPTVMPGPSNTGVPAGVTLTKRTGDIVITQPDTVLDGLDIYGYVTVKAPRCTIRNSIIRGGVQGVQVGIVLCATAGASLHIHDSEIVAQNPSYQVDGIRGYNITAERLNIHGVIDPCHFYGTGNVTLRASWLHDNLHYTQDPGWGGKPSHDDSVQIQSGSGYLIEGNRLEHSHNAAIQITQDAGVVSDVTIRRNYLAHGGVTINIAQKARPPFVGVSISDNLFGPSGFGQQLIRPALGDITFTGNARTDGATPKTVTRA